jgi:soluble lytic murein transglycosylase-like protein
MATLPQLGARRVARPTRGIATYDPGREGAAMEAFGNTGMQVADDLAKKQVQERDTQAVFAARRQVDEWERANLYDSQNGAVAKYGRDAFELPNTIPKAFDDFATKLMDQPMSPRAKQELQGLLASRRTQALGFVDRHTLQQRNVYDEGQVNADIESTLGRAALMTDAGDMGRAKAEVQLAQSRAVGFLKSRGKSEEEIASKVQEISSKAAITTVNVLLERDKPAEAEAFLKANAGALKPDDLLRAQGAVGKAMDARQGLVVAQTVVDTTLKPALAPTDFSRLSNVAGAAPDKLVALVMDQESRGKRYGADGKLLTSPKGAEGEMQVMPGTQKDPGYGVTPARDNSPDEKARVGRDYLAAMVKEFKGDVPMALAAYNAGPGAVQKAIETGGVNWLAKMPAETQAYVQSVTKKYSDGGGAPALPTLSSLHDQVRANIPADQPQRRKIALDEVTRQHEVLIKERKQAEDANTASAYKWLADNGGRFSQMPAGLRANVPAKEFDNLMTYGARVAKGDDITDPIVFQKMATDDKWLKGLTDAEFFIHSTKLSQADAQQMALRRGSLLNKEPADNKNPGSVDWGGVNSVLNNRLQQIGIDPSPKDASSEAQRVGAIRKYVADNLLQAQQAAGKRFNDAEIASTVDKLFATNVTFQTTFLGINTGKESQRLLSMKPGDIPGDVRDALKKDFAKLGITDPTDADMLGAYFQLRGARR